jgi:hypothetical protein
MNMQVRPLTELLGTEIAGVDLGQPLSEASAACPSTLPRLKGCSSRSEDWCNTRCSAN